MFEPLLHVFAITKAGFLPLACDHNTGPEMFPGQWGASRAYLSVNLRGRLSPTLVRRQTAS